MSKHIRPVFAVPETAVALAAVEKGVTAVGAVTNEVFLNNQFHIITFPSGGRCHHP
jgi:hypothetical protein